LLFFSWLSRFCYRSGLFGGRAGPDFPDECTDAKPDQAGQQHGAERILGKAGGDFKPGGFSEQTEDERDDEEQDETDKDAGNDRSGDPEGGMVSQESDICAYL